MWKLYVKYKSNPMNTNCDISKQKHFNQKGGQTDARSPGRPDARTRKSTAMSPITIVGLQKSNFIYCILIVPVVVIKLCHILNM